MDSARPRGAGSGEGKVSARHAFRRLRLAAALPLLAAAAAPNDPPRKPGWAIDYGAQRCALVRTGAGEDPLTLAIRMIPGRGQPEVIAARRGWGGTGFVGATSVNLVFAPSNRSFDAKALWLPNRLGLGDLLQLDGLPEDFIDLFAASTSVELRSRGKPGIAFPIPGAGRAVKALRDCNSALLAAWGVDEKAMAQLRQGAKPIGSFGSWIQESDFPRVALNQGISGTVVVRIDVDSKGALTGCSVVAGSGNLALDSQTCTSFRKRGRFEPAIGLDGKPVPISFVQTVVWLVGR
jgi:TonB family protein